MKSIKHFVLVIELKPEISVLVVNPKALTTFDISYNISNKLCSITFPTKQFFDDLTVFRDPSVIHHMIYSISYIEEL